MRTLVLGGLGMLGHKVAETFQYHCETWATVRSYNDVTLANQCLPGVQIYSGVDALDFSSIERAIDEIQPSIVVNCIGIIKQDALAYDPTTSIEVNALLPHRLANICNKHNRRLIHISTDCVFNGSQGNYLESSFADANDLYGRTKLLGEIHHEGGLTLRTSIIGPELRSSRSLLDWFLSQTGTANGYTRAIFSGLTTPELSRVIVQCATDWKHLSGLYHVSAQPITKFDLLTLVKAHYCLATEIQPQDEPVIDRSLDSTRFQETTGYRPPSWDEMVSELAALPQSGLIGERYVSSR
jgi:dTDP-4-dehydrorhamnose reductase